MEVGSFDCLAMIEKVAEALGDLQEKVVFVGGAVVGLYVQREGVTELRPTIDVDCVIEISSLGAFSEFEEQLRRRGFQHLTEPEAPICRWEHSGFVVDFMPTDPNILGFSNSWYAPGILESINYTLPSGRTVQILSVPFYIATKLEAFHSRGQEDYRMSPDIEDVIHLLSGRLDCSEDLLSSQGKLRQYLLERFGAYIQDPVFLEGLSASYPSGRESEKIVESLLEKLNRFVVLGS